MPTYEYACGACGAEFEVEQSIKDAAISRCPRCGKDEAKRQISRGGGFILKGGGWYSDLYASTGNKKSETKSEAKASSDATSSTSTSSDSGSSTSSTPSTSPSTGSSSGGSST